MTWFVVFVFGAMTLGAGAMLAPALPTQQPRVGLAGAVALALVVGGATFWTYLFGWDRLVVDYLVFGLVSVIIVGGTLSYGQMRAERRGELLSDQAQGWTSRWDLLLFAGILLAVLGLFAAFRPQTYLFNLPSTQTQAAPAYQVLTAYITLALGLNTSLINAQAAQEGINAVLILLAAWTVYDLGAETQNKTLGRIMAVLLLPALLILSWQWTRALLAVGPLPAGAQGWMSNFPPDALIAIPFTVSAVTFLWRFTRQGYPVDALLSGLMLGLVALSDPDTFLLTALLSVLLLLSSIRSQPNRPAIALVILGLCAVVTPYVLRGTLPTLDTINALTAIAPALALGAGLSWLLERRARARTAGQEAPPPVHDTTETDLQAMRPREDETSE